MSHDHISKYEDDARVLALRELLQYHTYQARQRQDMIREMQSDAPDAVYGELKTHRAQIDRALAELELIAYPNAGLRITGGQGGQR